MKLGAKEVSATAKHCLLWPKYVFHLIVNADFNIGRHWVCELLTYLIEDARLIEMHHVWWCGEHDAKWILAKWIMSKPYVKKVILAVMCWHAVEGCKVFLPFLQTKCPVFVCFIGWRYQKFGYFLIQCFLVNHSDPTTLMHWVIEGFRPVKQSLGTLKVQFFPPNWETRVLPLLASPFMKAITGATISLLMMSPICT
jgi:hypothetical protein